MPPSDGGHPLALELEDWIRAADFPCVGAKAALSRKRMAVVVVPDIRRPDGDLRIHAALLAFIARAKCDPTSFQTFAAVFEQPDDLSETQFEQALWTRIQALTDHDASIGHPWDRRVSADPANPHFSLSFAGEAFFVVGLHPGASRPARRFRSPVLVFNMHEQFERLRADGKYEGLRASILKRDMDLAGSINPMLQRFGEISEARQYSGRMVASDWDCPFQNGVEPAAKRPQ